MKSGQISEDVIQRKADSIRAMLKEKDAPPSQEEMSSLATFIHHKYITRVLDIELKNINLSDVAHVSSLTDVTNTFDTFRITGPTTFNISGNIAIISSIKCQRLVISAMRLSTEDTTALVQGMQTSVEMVQLGDSMELDWDTLLTYDGRGHCGFVGCYEQTMERYGDQLLTWGDSMGWKEDKFRGGVYIKRK